jgi:hypothetical protein
LKEVLSVCRKYDGVFAPHTRHHQFQYWSGKKGESIYGLYDGPKGEMFVGRYHGLLEASEVCFAAGGCRLHISHITPSTLIYHPHPASLDYALAEATLEDIVDAPYRKGLDITFDVLCSDFSIGAEKRLTTDLTAGALIRPKWMELPAAKGADRITIKNGKTPALEKHFAEQMKKSDAAAKLKELFDSGNMKVGMLHPVQDPYWFDCYRILKCDKKEYEGRMLSDIVFSKGKPTVESVYSVIYDVLVDILRADPQATWALVRDKREYKAMNVFMKHPLGTIGTDMGRIVPLRNAGKHLSGTETTLYGSGPYLFNGFIQYLVNATRRDCVMSMPQAIKHITSIPAQKVLHLENYGVLRENAWANIVLMDEAKLGYTVDFSDPTKAPTGLEYVFVNGKAAMAKGKLTGVINGHVVRKGGIYE